MKTKNIFAAALGITGVVLIFKYGNLYGWVKDNLFKTGPTGGTGKEGTDEFGRPYKGNTVFELKEGCNKQPEVAVIQLSLGNEMTGILNQQDITKLKAIGLNVVTSQDYAERFVTNEEKFKTQVIAFYQGSPQSIEGSASCYQQL